MKPKRTLAAPDTPVRLLIVTLDSHLVSAAARAESRLQQQFPGLSLTVFAASEWGEQSESLGACIQAIERSDLILVTMLFMEDHFQAILPALQARRDQCDAMVCAMSASEVMRFTRMGKLDMSGPSKGPMAWLKRFKPKNTAAKPGEADKPAASSGAAQMKMLRRLPKILRFIPGTAQDLRAYLLCLQYWLAGSEENLVSLAHLLIERYAQGPRAILKQQARSAAPIEYPEVGLYHGRMAPKLGQDENLLPSVAKTGKRGTVGLVLMRSYLLAGNTAHYDGVITALEAQGLKVLPVFATGLDARPAIERYFFKNGQACIDALVSLTGFSLVGGPAYNDSHAAEQVLSKLDVPYLSVTPVEFQSLHQWGRSERGLLPVEATMMIAIPELDGATNPMVFGGRAQASATECHGCDRHCVFDANINIHDMQTCSERANALSARVARLVDLRRSERSKRRIALVIFNFPPNAGNTGTAAFLSVFESLFNTLASLKTAGYNVQMPESVAQLRTRIIEGNAQRFGALANVHARISTSDHIRGERYLKEIEAQWGRAPGKHQSDGSSIFVYGERFGDVFIGVQPSMGFEGDPMRLLFDKGHTPTHAFSAFYRWLREDFKADAVLHFGTHGALEFMPGKQNGLSAKCWPDRLIGDLPNFYLYAANNPSEGTIAKRRSGATLISYLTPSVTQAGLYKGLSDLRASLNRWRSLDSSATGESAELSKLIRAQAKELELQPAQAGKASLEQIPIEKLHERLIEIEQTLIPHGLHVVGQQTSLSQRAEQLCMLAKASFDRTLSIDQALSLLQRGESVNSEEQQLLDWDQKSAAHFEMNGILHALDAGYMAPAPGADLLRNPQVLPAGRNLHGFDPFKIPSAFAVQDGARQAQRLLEKHMTQGNALPESVAIVLWGTDNLKSEGAPIAQALALMGAVPRFDSYGRLAGAQLIPLAELGRPRIDVVMSLSGIFRDLLPLQIRMLAEASYLCASADESTEKNFIRKHALAYQGEHGCDLETASLRVFGNAEGAYGANVNHLIDNSRWEDEDELAKTFAARKGFAYGRNGRPKKQAALMTSVLADVDLAYQNLDSLELGVTTIDTYFDTLGGISRAIKTAKGKDAQVAPVYIGDQTQGEGLVRTLSEQVDLETRTRMLNPKWYEGMLEHGYEGVRQLETHLTNTMGWSATTGQVQPWVYRQITETLLLDTNMRRRLAELNPTASAKLASRLLEASDRKYWSPDAQMLQAMRDAGDELEDRVEGIVPSGWAAT